MSVLITDTIYVGVDPTGGRQPLTYAAVDAEGHVLALVEGELDDLLAFAAGQSSAFIAVNAPARPNLGLVRRDEIRDSLAPLHQPGRRVEMRVAEHQLRERGISVGATPSHMVTAPTWIQLGFMLYRKLDSLGFQVFPSPDAPRQWLETHPHAIFCALLGQVPLPRHTLEGRIQRQLLLFEQGLGIRDPMDFFDEVTRHGILKGDLPFGIIHDPGALDAFAAALTASRAARSPGKIVFLGAPEEGQIVLPVAELKPRY
jgi:uncharacterized protein DUF429